LIIISLNLAHCVGLICNNIITMKGKGKADPTTGQEGPEGGVEV